MVDSSSTFLGSHPRGFRSRRPTDGYEALNQAGLVRPALVILDVMLPSSRDRGLSAPTEDDSENAGHQDPRHHGYPHMVPGLLIAGADALPAKSLASTRSDHELARLLALSAGA